MATIAIPPAHVEELRATTLALYSTKAEALHLAANSYLGDRDALAPLLNHRAELREIEALLDQLGWQFDQSSVEVWLDGSAHLIAELIEVTLIRELETLVGKVIPTEAPLDLEAMSRRLDGAKALVGLLVEIRAQGAELMDSIEAPMSADSETANQVTMRVCESILRRYSRIGATLAEARRHD